MATKICDTDYPGLQLEAQLCLKLYSAYSRLFGRFDRLLRAHNLNFTEYIILLMVWDEGPVDENAIAERLQFDPYTLDDGMVNLERQRRIRRTDNPDSLGNRVVEATVESLELRPALNAARQSFLCDSGLPEADWKALGAQLDKMSDALVRIGLDGYECAASAARQGA